jgi:glycosyltransferase involved in cell wall biosynthesis
MFSVVIPVYNKAPYLAKAIQSVKDQTFSDWELILVDDGSTDSSVDVINAFLVNSSNNIIFISQPNQGVSVARNNGVRSARYPYIAFLDADDWWKDNFLEEMNNLIKSFPDAGLYGCSYYRVKNSLYHAANIGVFDGFLKGYIEYFNVYARTFWVPINCSFVVVNKDSFNSIGGFLPKLKFGEDFNLWVRLALNYKVAYLNKMLAYSNQDVNLGNRALGKNTLFSLEENYIFNCSFLESFELNNIYLKKLLDGLRVRALLRYHLSGNFKKEVNIEISKVNFKQQTSYYRFIYKSPKNLVKLFFFLQKIGSVTKQFLIKSFIK